ncbi:putative hydrolase [Chondromyces apiculatus DSM 436]|uniref:Putative hydrolase n=1 Tax=Chondromyces apiculatus DSM 436 TaxID=1192034 RepID=A0A017SXM5_9BACT|nr:putative hydrolase [Chondromyces apiculatus DSM 436]
MLDALPGAPPYRNLTTAPSPGHRLTPSGMLGAMATEVRGRVRGRVRVRVHDGVLLEVEEHGEGAPLVLIAGIGYDRWAWHRMVPLLARHHRVIAFDNRGMGGSERPPGPYSADLLARDTASVIEALGLQRAHVMGHSMGGFVAQALTLARPDLVDRLILGATHFGGPRHVPILPEAMEVLTAVGLGPEERLRRGIAMSCMNGFAEAHPELLAAWLDRLVTSPVDPAAYRAQLAIGLALFAEEASFERHLGNVKARTLALSGAHDRVVPPGNATLLAQAIPDCRVALLPDAGHFFPIEAPDAAAAVILEFLAAP